VNLSRVRVSVPATSANLGPGFDCLGLALTLHNTIEMSLAKEGLTVEVLGEGQRSLPTDASNAIAKAAYAVFDRVGEVPPGLRIACTNGIPPGSGLGSSAAALVSGIVAANALLGDPLGRDELLALAAEMEGHADNAAPALLGGLVISSMTEDGLAVRRVPIPVLRVAVVTPAISTSTREQRAALPSMVAFGDAAANIGRALLVVQALADEDYDLLGTVMKDRLHQPYRRKSIPGYEQVVNAAYENGAAAIAISGAGPSLIAFAPGDLEKIGAAMTRAFQQHSSIEAKSRVLSVDSMGTRVIASQNAAGPPAPDGEEQ